MQSCSFAHLKLLHFWRSRCRCRPRRRRRRRCFSSLITCRDRANYCPKTHRSWGERRLFFPPLPHFPDHARPIFPWSCFRDFPTIWDPGAGCKKDDIAYKRIRFDFVLRISLKNQQRPVTKWKTCSAIFSRNTRVFHFSVKGNTVNIFFFDILFLKSYEPL